MVGFARRLGNNAVGLDECRASFEASLGEAPQDEAFFLMLSATYLMLRSDPTQAGRVSKHARHPMQHVGWVERRGWARMGVGLDQWCASFEASLCEAPQDDDLL
jgi:hypothetical protein